MPLSTSDNPIELETPILVATYKKNKTLFLIAGVLVAVAIIYFITKSKASTK